MILKNKLVVITGGASGIGEACVRRCVRQGATVVVADSNEAAGQEVARSLGDRHSFVHLDVADPGSWRAFVEKHKGGGAIDVLCLNAGVMTRPRGAPIYDDSVPWLNYSAYRKVMDVNCSGVVLGIEHCLPFMAQGSAIVAMASVTGFDALRADPLYTMSKHAVIGFVRAAADWLGTRGVTLTALCPSGIRTMMLPSDMEELSRQANRDYQNGDYVAQAMMRVLEDGKPGDVWMCRQKDHGFWIYEVPSLPDGPPAGSVFYSPE